MHNLSSESIELHQWRNDHQVRTHSLHLLKKQPKTKTIAINGDNDNTYIDSDRERISTEAWDLHLSKKKKRKVTTNKLVLISDNCE